MFYFCFVGVSAIQVTLSDNGPAVRGANVTFTATIVSGYTGENFKYLFTDNGVPQHKQEVSKFRLILLVMSLPKLGGTSVFLISLCLFNKAYCILDSLA